MDPELNPLYTAIIEGDRDGAEELVRTALDNGWEANDILRKALIPAMDEVGRLFEEGDYFVPEMLVAARAMKASLAILQPYLVDAEVEPAGKVILGTVKGDMHDIGKNLVGIMLEGAGFHVIDLETDVSPDRFIEAIRNHEADIVGLSALLTTTMPAMQATIDAITAAGLRDDVKIIVGGAPVTASYAEDIGADGYAADASRAATLARQLMA